MNIDEYLETLPENLLSGEDVQLPERSLREIFKFAELKKDDIFYHLGCGDEKGIEIWFLFAISNINLGSKVPSI